MFAIACRDGLSAEVAEAISATEDKSAIKALLENLTAVINEKAMIAIGTHAPDIPDWHRPLVDRDSLSEKTIRRIATFVSAALFERLIDKHGVDPDVESELRLSVRQRIESGAVPDDSLPQVLRYEPPVWLTGIDAWVWPGHEVVAMIMQKTEATQWQGVKLIPYAASRGTTQDIHPWVSDFETKTQDKLEAAG